MGVPEWDEKIQKGKNTIQRNSGCKISKLGKINKYPKFWNHKQHKVRWTQR
jgi:hypothetical protein